MTSSFLLLLQCVCVHLLLCHGANLNSSSSGSTMSFEEFIKGYDRPYEPGTAEYAARRLLFNQRVAKIQEHNAKRHRLWTAGINHLSDWTEEELKMLRGWKGAHVAHTRNMAATFASKAPPPKSFDWLSNGRHNLTTSARVYDQADCGSCWAVGSGVVLNMHSEIYMGSSRTYSINELVNCAPNPDDCGGTGGCGGSTAELAMNYIMHNGIDSEKEIPYSNVQGKCHKTVNAATMAKGSHQLQAVGVRSASPEDGNAFVSSSGLRGWERLPQNEYLPLLRAVAEKGPVAITVNADNWADYSSGVFQGCGWTVNHLVVLFGYGQVDVNKGKTKWKKINFKRVKVPIEPKMVKFYHIQNSWGDYWGDNGRIKLIRTDNDQTNCGTDPKPEVGTGCKGGPKTVQVCGTCGILYDNVVPIF
eukprot:gnl/TRDRNA2_/TRDRNA2_155528_c0_seq8.p1 gnl/TRDRNA2_/TRDRNA2_155528_c0~~gnl/TRDRNA2_/TRDRNA2_155528_c0_seq8.p1  ORF type:complete len:417 (-),score=68.83 gnl/TRDRNA2_/TRDRNA2_155528_c0_seq8:127-1377(-)